MRILTQEQARALYAAMRALNDIDANFEFFVETASGDFIVIKDDADTCEVFVKLADGTLLETYESQPDFVQAYGVPT